MKSYIFHNHPLDLFQKNYNVLNKFINIKHKDVSIDYIKSSLLVKQREANNEIPDHYYLQKNIAVFKNINSISDLFSKSLLDYANKYLTIDYDDTLYIQEKEFLQWQNIIADISPLLLEAAFLVNNTNLIDFSSQHVQEYYKKYIETV